MPQPHVGGFLTFLQWEKRSRETFDCLPLRSAKDKKKWDCLVSESVCLTVLALNPGSSRLALSAYFAAPAAVLLKGTLFAAARPNPTLFRRSNRGWGALSLALRASIRAVAAFFILARRASERAPPKYHSRIASSLGGPSQDDLGATQQRNSATEIGRDIRPVSTPKSKAQSIAMDLT